MSTNEDLMRALLDQAPRRGVRLPLLLADEIAADVFARGLEPGAPLPTEAEMVTQFDVSRATLREALRVLETRGVIDMRTGRGRGPVVAQPNIRTLVETLSTSLRLLKTSFDEVLATRAAIEPALAEQAALNRTQDELDLLWQVHQEMTESVGDSARMRALNQRFHTVLAVASANRPLVMLWSAISAVADGQGRDEDYTEEMWAAGLRIHVKIIESVEARDAAAARRRMERHVRGFHSDVMQRYPERLSRPVFSAKP